MGIAFDENSGIDVREYKNFQNGCPEKLMLLTLYWLMDSKEQQYFKQEWNAEKQAYENVYFNNSKIDNLYYFLEELGYQTSKEEYQMRRGTHELFDGER